MACCHHVLLLLDTAGGAAGRSAVRRAALRLLLYLSCRFGPARVRWAFRFFDSQGARGRPSRVSDFRELGARSWEDFEEELEARLGDGAAAAAARLPGPAPRAAHTHGALMETLLDYQWDRPEITSPAKPALRRHRGRRRLLDAEGEAAEAGAAALGGSGNAVFLLGPCPRSQRELVQFACGCEAQARGPPPAAKQLMEKLLPRRVREVMVSRKVTLYWVDTAERSKVRERVGSSGSGRRALRGSPGLAACTGPSAAPRNLQRPGVGAPDPRRVLHNLESDLTPLPQAPRELEF